MVNRTINNLFRQGAEVLYQGIAYCGRRYAGLFDVGLVTLGGAQVCQAGWVDLVRLRGIQQVVLDLAGQA